MNADSYYARLNIEEGASEDEIKTAFRRLALKYHPDKNPGDPEAERLFKEVAAAYDALSDPIKRGSYDFTRGGGVSQGADFFSRFGGAGARACGGGRGCCGKRGRFNRRAAFGFACVMELSPEEARNGTEKEFIMEAPSGHSAFSVSIPPGTENGAVFRVNVPAEGFPAEGFDIHIKIV